MKSIRDYIGLVESVNALEAVAPTTTTATPPAPSGLPPELAKLGSVKPGTEYWVNGTRYEYNQTGERDPSVQYYRPMYGWAPTFKPGDWGWNTNQAKARAKYTGPNDGQIDQAADAAKSQVATAPKAGQGAKPAAPTAPSDPNVVELQKKLIAAGATNIDGTPLKADGIMGKNTRAAQQKFPNVTTQSDAEKAVAADIAKGDTAPATQGAKPATPHPGNPTDWANGINPPPDWEKDSATGKYHPPGQAPAAPAAPAEPNPYAANPKQAEIYAAMSPEDKAWATKGGGRPDLTDPYIAARAPNGFKPVAKPADAGQGAKPAAIPGNTDPTKGPVDYSLTGGKPAPKLGPVSESTTFQNDELARIMSIIQHR